MDNHGEASNNSKRRNYKTSRSSLKTDVTKTGKGAGSGEPGTGNGSLGKSSQR